MISRKTTQTLAELYNSLFGSPRRDGYGDYIFRLNTTQLYDYLFVNDYSAWFMNAAKGLSTIGERNLIEFIMKLHTGETLAAATANWDWKQRQKLGQQYLQNLSEDVIQKFSDFLYASDTSKKLIQQLKTQLELDGYVFKDGRLLASESGVMDTGEEEGVIIHLSAKLGLPDVAQLKRFIDLSEEHYIAGRWEDSISNSRKALESILEQTAKVYHRARYRSDLSSSTLSSAESIRNYLKNEGLLEVKEKEAVTKVYAVMSDTGSHPYMAAQDQSRLMRHLALTFSQFVLLRLEGSLSRGSDHPISS
jgi:hypothetical protein